MNNPKTINLIGNILLAFNFLAGIVQLHWAVIIIFAICHAFVRTQFLALSEKLAHASQDPQAQKTVTAPPMIRNVASLVTAIIVAAALYGIGYGLHYLFNTIMS